MTVSNQTQIDLWQGRVGEKWAALQGRLDAMLATATAELKARAGSVAGLRLLDIGCGTGASCLIWSEGGDCGDMISIAAAFRRPKPAQRPRPQYSD